MKFEVFDRESAHRYERYTETFSIQLEPGVKIRFKQECAARGHSMSAVLRAAIYQYITWGGGRTHPLTERRSHE